MALGAGDGGTFSPGTRIFQSKQRLWDVCTHTHTHTRWQHQTTSSSQKTPPTSSLLIPLRPPKTLRGGPRPHSLEGVLSELSWFLLVLVKK